MKVAWTIPALLLSSCSACSDGAQSVKPLRVHVVDAVSGRPLGGVRVVFAVQTLVPAAIPRWAPQLGGPMGPRLAYASSVVTDASGDATLRPVLELKTDRERVDQLLILANLSVNMASEPARLLWEALDAHCKERPEICSRADADIQVAAHIVSGGAEEGDLVFVNPISKYLGKVLVLNVDPAGAERPRGEEWGAVLDLERMPMASLPDGDVVSLLLREAVAVPTKSKARFQK